MAAAGELGSVLSGRGWRVPECCDSLPPEPGPPVRVRRSACYIVLAVLLREPNEVLMMQEAKRECNGTWYLPAGRMEPNETIVEAMQREVKEETGLQCQPLTLLAVEERGPAWIRFVFLAQPTGGALKTLQDADAESLQALWCDRESPPHPLRARDILPLIDLAVQYQASPSHPPTLPVELPCTFICQRLLVAFSSGTGDVWILLSSTGSLHLPVTASGTSPSELNSSLQVAVHRLLEQCLPLPQMAIQTRGLLGLQHLGKGAGQSDGVCFNVLVTVQHSGQGDQEFPPEMQGDTVTWWKVEDETLKSRILERLNVASVVPVYS